MRSDHPSIHPFSIPASVQFWVTRVCWSLSRLSRGKRQGTPWISRQPIAGLPLKDRQSFTLTHTYGQFRLINSPDKHVLDYGRKPECPEKTHTCTGRTCKLHTERPEPRFEPQTFLLWGDSDNHRASMLPSQSDHTKKKFSWIKKNTLLLKMWPMNCLIQCGELCF